MLSDITRVCIHKSCVHIGRIVFMWVWVQQVGLTHIYKWHHIYKQTFIHTEQLQACECWGTCG